MSEQCIIEGKRCTACCKVIRLRRSEHMMAWMTDDKEYADSDMGFIKKNWVILTEEAAARLNPFLVYGLEHLEEARQQVYFTCLRRSEEGCSIHEDRPTVCSGYPNYETPLGEYLESRTGPEYTPECTYWKEGLIKRLLNAINCK